MSLKRQNLLMSPFLPLSKKHCVVIDFIGAPSWLHCPVYTANCSHILPKVTALTALSEDQVLK